MSNAGQPRPPTPPLRPWEQLPPQTNARDESSQLLCPPQYRVRCIARPPKRFRGPPATNENINEFLLEMEVYFDITDVTQEDRRRYIFCFLSGYARMIYSQWIHTGATEVSSWDAAKASLKKNFDVNTRVSVALRERIMKRNERLETFITDFVRIARTARWDFTDKQIAIVFANALSPPYAPYMAQYISRNDVSYSLPILIQAARNAQVDVENIKQLDTHQQEMPPNDCGKYNSKKRSRNDDEDGNDRAERKKHVKCWNCQHFGHYQNQCQLPPQQ